MPSKKKKYNARFPAGRIKKIMQTDEEVGKVAQAVPVIISRTLELFVESLLKKSMQITLSRNAKTLTPSHMKQCILSESRFDFLKDLVKDIPDASVQEDNENNDIFEDGFNHNDVDVEAPAPLPSHSKRKHSTTEAGPKDRLVHKIELTGPREPKKRKLPATEVSSPSSSSSSSPYSVPSSPHLIPPPTAANYYKDHQQQQSTSTRTPVIQYSPKLTQNHNQNADATSQASQLTFSVNSLLSQNTNNVISSEDSNLRITVAPDHLSSPPVAGTTSSSKAGSVVSPKLTPSENVPPLVPLRVPPAPVASPPTQGSSPKYRPAPGDLSIDEDYDN